MASRLQRRMALRRKLHILRTLTSSKSVIPKKWKIKNSSTCFATFLFVQAFMFMLMFFLFVKVKKSSIIMDTILHINALKLRLEAIKREYSNSMKLNQVVKVEKIGTRFLVRVTCKKGRDVLVSILEALDEIGLNVLQARVSCNYYFAMEAITEAQAQALDVGDVTQTVLKAIELEE
ncbi:hypothetical protein L1049_009994 [Liquidambar formosana]|uniref:Plant bHLH transcription factor ACT-like domain-containing protein n=1 Tax=Liquidambar formosana TaxID=63359 RepID=A0AAP0N8A9_LIQFO